MKIKDIIIYPIKSLGGIHLAKSQCTEKGLSHDRCMMLADEKGQFVTQRDFPQLATIGASMHDVGFDFFKRNKPSDKVEIGFNESLGSPDKVKVWGDEFLASPLLGDAGRWFSELIGKEVRLYKITDASDRTKSFDKSPGVTHLGMSDGYPYLFLSLASLADLNARLTTPVPMNRFRPNIVLDDTEAYEEETLDSVLIGQVPFRMMKPCGRCIMITINQITGEKNAEPLRVLSTYRQEGKKIIFGMNAISLLEGEIEIGNEVSKIE